MHLTQGVRNLPFSDGVASSSHGLLGREIGGTVSGDGAPVTGDLGCVDVSSVPRVRHRTVIRHRVVDPRFTTGARSYNVVLSRSRDVDVVVNRRSRLHVRMVGTKLGFGRTCTITSTISDFLSSRLGFTFSGGLNCLARYPAGLKAKLHTSIVLRLPVLRRGNRVTTVARTMSGVNFAVHNVCNRNSGSSTSLCRVSGRVALNVDRDSTLRGLDTVIARLVRERGSRERKLSEGGTRSTY